MRTCKILFLLIFFHHAVPAAAQWQWSTMIESVVSEETGSHPRAFLWIPERCTRVRAVIVGMHNMQEEGIMEHPVFRSEMSVLDIAQIWITPGLDPLFDPAKGSGEQFKEMFSSLASISGYSEIETVPVIPIGHSAHASYPSHYAAWNPGRTLAVLSVHGDAPQTNLTGCGRPNLDWETRNTDGVPGLMVMGEYEWWEDRLAPAIEYKNKHRNAPVSLLADAGHGHFDHSDMLIEYLAMFVRKAVEYRLPEGTGEQMRKVLPEDGWLADRWHKDAGPSADAAAHSEYKGDRKSAFWYFDREIAEATQNYYSNARGKTERHVGFRRAGELLAFDPGSHAGYTLRLTPGNEALRFNISAVFTDESHTTVNEPDRILSIDRICGPVKKIDDTTFVVRFYRMGLDNPKRTGDIWLAAHDRGDGAYKSSVQQLNIRVQYPLTDGAGQTVTFDPLPDIKAGECTIVMNAVSDSGLPVFYYVKEGPVEIGNDGELTVTRIPPRAKYPVKVTVVAWQYGRAYGDRIRSSEPVERSFYITR